MNPGSRLPRRRPVALAPSESPAPFRNSPVRAFIAGLSITGALVAATAALASAAEPPPGRDTFERLCSGCHDLALATDTRRSRAEWRDLVERMSVYGLSGSDAERAEVIDYLARAFPPVAP